MIHFHDIISKNLRSITIKEIKDIEGLPAEMLNGLKLAIDNVGNSYYFYSIDNFSTSQEPLEVIFYEFDVPSKFQNPFIPERLPFIARNISNSEGDIEVKSIGKLCSFRMAAFIADKKLMHIKIDDYHYIPMEGIYDDRECTGNNGGLVKDEFHGYFIKLDSAQFVEYQSSYNLGTQLGTIICPGEANNTGMFIYEHKHIKV